MVDLTLTHEAKGEKYCPATPLLGSLSMKMASGQRIVGNLPRMRELAFPCMQILGLEPAILNGGLPVFSLDVTIQFKLYSDGRYTAV